MAKKKKSPNQQPTEDIPMADNKDIMVITGVKVKHLSLQENEYGHDHFQCPWSYTVTGFNWIKEVAENVALGL